MLISKFGSGQGIVSQCLYKILYYYQQHCPESLPSNHVYSKHGNNSVFAQPNLYIKKVYPLVLAGRGFNSFLDHRP